MFTPLLADLPAPESAQAVGWIMLSVFAIAGGLYYVLSVWRMLSGKEDGAKTPQPLIVKKHDGSVTDAELREVHGRIKREREELNRDIAALAAEDSRLRERLDRDIGDLHERINDVPARVISLLRETKGLI